MQIARNGRGRCHGAWQPEMEGELRAFGQRAQQHQHQHGRVQGAGTHLVAGLEHHIQIVAAHDMAQQNDAAQHGQPARARYGQRRARAAPCVFAVVPVADQHEREQAGQLPEKHQLHQIARSHHANHGAHKGQQKRKEARHRVFGRHVVARINRHQQANAGNQQGKQPGKAIQPQNEVEPRFGQPALLVPQDGAGL